MTSAGHAKSLPSSALKPSTAAPPSPPAIAFPTAPPSPPGPIGTGGSARASPAPVSDPTPTTPTPTAAQRSARPDRPHTRPRVIAAASGHDALDRAQKHQRPERGTDDHHPAATAEHQRPR